MCIIKLETSYNATKESRIVVQYLSCILNSVKVEVLSEYRRELHNLAAKYEN